MMDTAFPMVHAVAVMAAAFPMVHALAMMPSGPLSGPVPVLPPAVVAHAHLTLGTTWLLWCGLRLHRWRGKGPDQRRGHEIDWQHSWFHTLFLVDS